MRAVQVDIWSDIACPWCWIGKRRLEEAITLTDLEVRVQFHAFQLNPSAPTSFEGDPDYVGRLARKYGRTRAEAQAMIDTMTKTGADAGVVFAFDSVLPVNTFDAHRVIAFAKSKGRQLAAKEEFLRAYFTDGKSLTNPDVLVSVAASAGLDVDEVLAIAKSNAYKSEVAADIKRARELQISGVPFFLIGGMFGVSGAQPAETLANVLRQAADRAQAENTPSALDGEVCGPSGCTTL